tara:strand:+ start:109 stop:771 length:663 start_codon:yes stop_codon:yes gene_type:complete
MFTSIKNFIKFLKHKIIIRIIQNFKTFTIFALSKETKLVNIDIGSGSTISFFDNYICTDKYNFNLLNFNHMYSFLKKRKIKNIFAEHVFEHLDQDEMIIALKNLEKFMEIGSRIRIAVPDGYNPSKEYIRNVQICGVGPGADNHKQLLNHEKVRSIFEENLTNYKLQFIEYFDKKGNFNSHTYINIGKEIQRSSKSKVFNKSFYLSHLSLIFDVVKIKSI